MEVEVKMEQNQKMKNLILTQVSNAVHMSSEGKPFYPLKTKSKSTSNSCILLFCKLSTASIK